VLQGRGIAESDGADSPAVVVAVALVASLIPSLRAIRIHPSTALRYE
jgi:hypothetical protein